MIAPFELPLSREEFKGAMELGHGRALLHARKYGLAEYRDDFLTACLSNLVFDTQYEDSRTRWLGEFFDSVFDSTHTLNLQHRLSARLR